MYQKLSPNIIKKHAAPIIVKNGTDTLCICLTSLYRFSAILSEISLEMAIGKPAVAIVKIGT